MASLLTDVFNYGTLQNRGIGDYRDICSVTAASQSPWTNCTSTLIACKDTSRDNSCQLKQKSHRHGFKKKASLLQENKWLEILHNMAVIKWTITVLQNMHIEFYLINSVIFQSKESL